MAATFDCGKFTVNSDDLTCAPTTFSAGRGLGGFEQIVGMENSYWRGTFELNPLYGENYLAWRGFVASLRGRSNTFDLCLCEPHAIKTTGKTDEEILADLGLPPATLCGPIAGVYGLPFADGTCFLDGTGFPISNFRDAAPSADVPAGASTMPMTSLLLVAGSRFSTSDNFLYQVTCVENGIVSFEPPLRSAITAGTSLETEHPKIKVRLAADLSGRMTSRFGKFSEGITISVVEAFDR